jgi:GxxExxY protein
MADIIYREESYAIIGACMRVHQGLGAGFLEAVYQEALTKEFVNLDIPFESQKKLSLYYNDEKLNKYYKADFLCFDKVVLEIKAVDYMNNNMRNQLLNYLKATKMKLGLLINFGKRSLEYKRILNPNVSPSL